MTRRARKKPEKRETHTPAGRKATKKALRDCPVRVGKLLYLGFGHICSRFCAPQIEKNSLAARGEFRRATRPAPSDFPEALAKRKSPADAGTHGVIAQKGAGRSGVVPPEIATALNDRGYRTGQWYRVTVNRLLKRLNEKHENQEEFREAGQGPE
jgi:hypothetical protein